MKRLGICVVFFSCLYISTGFCAEGVSVNLLSNGQALIFSEDRSLPICYVYAVVNGGYVLDSETIEGLTGLMGDMLMRGTEKRSREQIQDELDQMGAEIDVAAGAESLMVVGQTLTKNIDRFLTIFSDVVLHPSFDLKEFGKEKRESIEHLKQMRENDRALASRFFKRGLFGDYPYGLDPAGRESTIAKITQGEVRKQYQKQFVRENVFFAASGDVGAAELVAKLSHHFSSFPSGKSISVAYPPFKQKEGIELWLIDKPARTQTQIIMGHVGIDILDPDFFPLMVANNAFGGGFTAKLMQEVRVKRGWSYGASSWFNPRKKPGEFGIWVFPAEKDTVETLKLVLSLYEDYAEKGITPEEFDRSKKNLINEYAFKIDTAQKRVSQLVMMKLMNLPSDYLETYQQKLKAVTFDQVTAVIRKHSDPKNLMISVVCTAKNLIKNLKSEFKKLGKNIRIVTKNYKVD